MAQKTRDLRPDTVLKNYWSGNEQFADIFNAVLFEGRQVIRPEELEDKVDKTVIMTVPGATNCKIDYNALSGKGCR